MMRDLKGLQWKAYTKANVDAFPSGQKGVYFLRSRGEIVLVGSSPIGFAMRPEAAEAFFIDLLGGKHALKFNSLMTGAKSLEEVLSQSFSECPLCHKPW